MMHVAHTACLNLMNERRVVSQHYMTLFSFLQRTQICLWYVVWFAQAIFIVTLSFFCCAPVRWDNVNICAVVNLLQALGSYINLANEIKNNHVL